MNAARADSRPRGGTRETLIPNGPGSSPSYWSTWLTQNLALSTPALRRERHDARFFSGAEGAGWARNNLSERLLFGESGWARSAFSAIRGDLFLVLDDGWDVPRDTLPSRELWRFGSLEMDGERFPSCTGSPAERLAAFNAMARESGWRGGGVWVAAQTKGDPVGEAPVSDAVAARYWRERASWSRQAGIGYWKVDWGARGKDVSFRRAIGEAAHEEHPGLIVEHAWGMEGFNDWKGLQRFRTYEDCLKKAVELMGFTRLLRAYDVIAPLTTATMLDRLSELFTAGFASGGPACILNAEDEVYLGAALGCALGLMRHPGWSPLPGQQWDVAGTWQRVDEAVRAVRWQRIAPAFPVGAGTPQSDEMILSDSWRYAAGETWLHDVTDRLVVQQAPARFSRGMPLPVVHAASGIPWVAASRHPNGAVAVAALPRVSPGKPLQMSAADVELEVADLEAPVGVFGLYRTLLLHLGRDARDRALLAQDLAGDTVHDISARVAHRGSALVLGGDLLKEIGLSEGSPGDVSLPGLVVRLGPPGSRA